MPVLRPNREYCDRDLPFDSADARICTFECIFCSARLTRVTRATCP